MRCGVGRNGRARKDLVMEMSEEKEPLKHHSAGILF